MLKMGIVSCFTVATLMLLSGITPAYAQEETVEGAYGDWMAACEEVSADLRKCAIWQVASTAIDGPRLLHVEISFHRPFDSNSTELLIIMPLGVSLHTGPALHIDQKWVADFKLDFCLTDGCYARAKMSPELLEQFLHMDSAELNVKSGAGEAIALPISGKGSRAAFNSTE